MRSFDVAFSREADADFDAIIDFIARDNPHRAISFVNELQERATAILSRTPYAGRREGRYRVLSQKGYVVVCIVDEERALVRVLMVSEGHRDWQPLAEARQ